MDHMIFGWFVNSIFLQINKTLYRFGDFEYTFSDEFFNKGIGSFGSVFAVLDVYIILLDISDAEGSSITVYTFFCIGYCTETNMRCVCIVHLISDHHM